MPLIIKDKVLCTLRKPRAIGGEGGSTDTFLKPETEEMYAELRNLIQDKIRKLAKVNALKNRDIQNLHSNAPQGESNNPIAEHPYLEKQCFDGIDPPLSSRPEVNTEAYQKYEQAKLEQDELKRERALELAKQLNPELAPSFTPGPSFNPKPKGP